MKNKNKYLIRHTSTQKKRKKIVINNYGMYMNSL